MFETKDHEDALHKAIAVEKFEGVPGEKRFDVKWLEIAVEQERGNALGLTATPSRRYSPIPLWKGYATVILAITSRLLALTRVGQKRSRNTSWYPRCMWQASATWSIEIAIARLSARFQPAAVH